MCRSHVTQSGHIDVTATESTKQYFRRLGSLCYRLCVCVSPEFISPKPCPRRDGAQKWAVRMGSSGQISALQQETAKGLLLYHASTQGEDGHPRPERGPNGRCRCQHPNRRRPDSQPRGKRISAVHTTSSVLSQQPERDEAPSLYPYSLRGALLQG